MLEAGRAANRHQVPIILDPVGAGATSFLSQAVHQLLAGLDITLIKGNAGEVAHLAGADWRAQEIFEGQGKLSRVKKWKISFFDILEGN